VTLSKFHPDDPHFCSDLSAKLLFGTSLCACTDIHFFVCKAKTVMILLKILSTNIIQLADEGLASVR
jgi:hypothetical protein